MATNSLRGFIITQSRIQFPQLINDDTAYQQRNRSHDDQRLNDIPSVVLLPSKLNRVFSFLKTIRPFKD
jgi:hypothetical protein